MNIAQDIQNPLEVSSRGVLTLRPSQGENLNPPGPPVQL